MAAGQSGNIQTVSSALTKRKKKFSCPVKSTCVDFFNVTACIKSVRKIRSFILRLKRRWEN